MKKVVLIALLLAVGACSPVLEDQEPMQFQLHKKERTGLDFENVVRADSVFNVFTYMYFFNGGGVSAGDFNQDGLVDLFFTSNMSSNKLFLNQGDLKFEEVTDLAGLGGQEGWTTGTSVVDINQDGLLDIYVSQMGDYLSMKGHNQLYICQKIENGIPVFKDMAVDYGLDLVGFATQAAFLDYDLDGDLDLFQLNHTLHQNGTFGRRVKFSKNRDEKAGDRLFRNDSEGSQLRFTEVTETAGIYSTVIGYGLGIVPGDINQDGWPDLYIGNDFHENDYLYINQKDGTFKEVLTEQIRHTSRFSMGVDMADINNDGLNEIISLDMLPEDPHILKTSLGEDGYSIFTFKLGHGYNPQFSKNNLQLNNGNGTFSEIAMFSGVFATDWSWAPLFFDFDHDGYKDLFISNGIPRRMNDIDYINYKSSTDLRFKAGFNRLENDDLSIIEKMPQIKLKNKFFSNQQDLTFDDLGTQIAGDATSYSNGAVYADLDNDGDLDVVVNNIGDEPFLYENLCQQDTTRQANHYLHLKLKGSSKNKQAIGAKVVVFKGAQQLVAEHFPVRGYQSSVAPGIHLGVGAIESIDSVLLIWPDRTYQKLAAASFDQQLTITWKEGLPMFDYDQLRKPLASSFSFEDIAAQSGLDFEHEENPFVDFNREGLMPHMVSADGPALAVGDVDGDGLEDVFFGGAKRLKSALYRQNKSGTFDLITAEIMATDSIYEDVDAVFVDIDQDGDQDLVVASGGNEYRLGNEETLQRIYLNENGRYTKRLLFPESNMTASCVLVNDVNGDGLPDFFFGARALPRQYGLSPTSMLFENKGKGQFEKVTEKYSKDLANVGMVKHGSWADLDQDGDEDLILAVEWEPITVFEKEGDQLIKRTLNEASGWWNFVLPHDLDGDGDLDLLAGNLGKNSKFQPTPAEPVRLYINDYDDNGQIEQILTYYLDGKEIPFANYAELTKQMVSLKKKYLYSKDMANASLEAVFGEQKIKEADVLQVTTLESVWFENTGQLAEFKMHALPDPLQLSTFNTATRLRQSDSPRFLTGGNFLKSNIEMGWYDADYGHVLSFTKNGQAHAAALNGLTLNGVIRKMAAIKMKGEICYIVAQNDGKVQLLSSSLQ